MSVKLSSITTAATKFNFGKSNLYDFIFFKSCHFITFCISSLLHHWVSPSTLSRTNFLQTILSSLFFWWYLRVEETWSLHFWMPESEFWNVTPLFFTYWNCSQWSKFKNDVSDETKNLLVIKIKRSLAEFFLQLVFFRTSFGNEQLHWRFTTFSFLLNFSLGQNKNRTSLKMAILVKL